MLGYVKPAANKTQKLNLISRNSIQYHANSNFLHAYSKYVAYILFTCNVLQLRSKRICVEIL